MLEHAAFAGRIRALKAEPRQNLAARVEHTISTPGWADVADELEQEVREIERDLQRPVGRLPSRSQYAHAHGRIEGLRHAIGFARAVVEVNADEERKAEMALAQKED